MGSKLVLRQRGVEKEGSVWKGPAGPKAPGGVRYRLAFIPAGARKPAVLYDNHHPKGHHRHVRGVEEPYRFTTVDRLIEDFRADVERVRRRLSR